MGLAITKTIVHRTQSEKRFLVLRRKSVLLAPPVPAPALHVIAWLPQAKTRTSARPRRRESSSRATPWKTWKTDVCVAFETISPSIHSINGPISHPITLASSSTTGALISKTSLVSFSLATITEAVVYLSGDSCCAGGYCCIAASTPWQH